MPVVAIPLEDLNAHIGAPLSASELEALLRQLGCDIEEFTKLRRVRCLRCGALQELTLREELPASCPDCQAEAPRDELWEDAGEVDVVRMDLLPVRPDLFDAGGLARAVRGLLGEEMGPVAYDVAPATFRVTVDPAMSAPESYRPHIRCAVVRGLSLDDVSLRAVMKLQELLHWALGRDRKLASIGVYDLACLAPEVRYTAVDPDEFRFVPLQTTDGAAVTPRAILEEHPKGKAYAHLLANLKRYPVLVDANGQTLSMPPIINSHETRLHLDTTDVFIDVTGLTERAVTKSLHTLVASLLELFPEARAEAVEMVFPTGTRRSPDFSPEPFVVDVARAARLIGMDIDGELATELLRKMRHGAHLDGDRIQVQVPAYRNDIMHPVDLIEDIAIAFGYDNVTPRLVRSMTVGHPRPEQVLAGRARGVMVGLGYAETMSLLLTNEKDCYELLDRPNPGDAVRVDNPISVEQTMLRTDILPQLLKLFAVNRGQGLPQKLFEVDDVVRVVPGVEQPVEELHLAAGHLDTTVGFADVKALAECIGRELGIDLVLAPCEHPAFLPGRVAALRVGDDELGVCGEVHPAVLERLRLVTPLVALELNLQPLVAD